MVHHCGQRCLPLGPLSNINFTEQSFGSSINFRILQLLSHYKMYYCRDHGNLTFKWIVVHVHGASVHSQFQLPVPFRVLYYGSVYDVFWSFSDNLEITNIVIFCSLPYQCMLIYRDKVEMNSDAQRWIIWRWGKVLRVCPSTFVCAVFWMSLQCVSYIL
jgi:hypothetical protein